MKVPDKRMYSVNLLEKSPYARRIFLLIVLLYVTRLTYPRIKKLQSMEECEDLLIGYGLV